MKKIPFINKSVRISSVGLPRAMLYYRYEILWKNFFSYLGLKYIVSEPTNKEMIREGTAVSIDEACLSTKIYMGHIKSLIGKCDYILVPRISNFFIKRSTRISCICLCNRFMSCSWFSVSKYLDRSTDTAYLYPSSPYSFTF